MTTDASKRGRGSRNKGANGERELAKILREQYGIEAQRGKVFYHESDLIGIPGIHPEVKRVERLNIHEAVKQAIDEAEKRKDGKPVVFHRRNRGGWLVTLRLEDFMNIYQEATRTPQNGQENPQADKHPQEPKEGHHGAI